MDSSPDRTGRPGHDRRRPAWFRPSRRLLLPAGSIAVAILVGLWLTGRPSEPMPRPSIPSTELVAGSDAMFQHLAQQHSNYCSLDQATVERDPSGAHLQGSCCSAMDAAKYRYQVAQLKRYATMRQIPADPYDIQVSLAKTLLVYDHTVGLSATDHAEYTRAMSITADKGPCCCHCWRWYMTEGLAKYLISERHMPAPQLAKIVDLVNGCGGSR